jgi:hypothetical protein
MRLLSPAGGLSGAAVVSLLLCPVTLWQGKSVKILELGSLVLFGWIKRPGRRGGICPGNSAAGTPCRLLPISTRS